MVHVRDAKRKLGLRRLILQIHDLSFPARADEDTGRGSPYSYGAQDFLKFAQRLGFDGIQFGPQGQTSRGNPCPYDGRLFPFDILSISVGRLSCDPVWESLLAKDSVQRAIASRPDRSDRTHHKFAWDAVSTLIDEVFCEFRKRNDSQDAMHRAFDEFVETNAVWLERDEIPGRSSRHAFAQFVLDQQRRQLRQSFPELRFYGDLQIGMGPEDARQFSKLFLDDYAMGAPPSRTNPDGQPWGYAVFHPDRLKDGSALEFFQQRVTRMLNGFDGIRVDHPHGLVCPWVYLRDQESQTKAVQAGARLYESPDLAEHPHLAKFSIARPEQLNPNVPRYEENRCRDFDDDQVAQYSCLIDIVLKCVREAGGDLTSDVACEVLSTQPYPLRQVMERHGLGRFRVVQKARLDEPNDVYRIENAQPADWIMLGNHDTPPIWKLASEWCSDARGIEWAEYLSDRLKIAQARRRDFISRASSDPSELIHALFAAMLASTASHVSMFFVDLLGITDAYNRPGVVSDANWNIRVPSDFEAMYESRLRAGKALDIEKSLQMAIEARNTNDAR